MGGRGGGHIRTLVDMCGLSPSEHLGPIVDMAGGYFGGEEGVRGWRPRRESLIVEHREQLLRLLTIEEVGVTMVTVVPTACQPLCRRRRPDIYCKCRRK